MSHTSRSSGGFFLAMAAGLAAGVAIGYFLNSEEKEEMVASMREKMDRLKARAGELSSRIKDKFHHINDPIDEVAG